MPSVAGFVGAFGFGGAIAAALTGGGLGRRGGCSSPCVAAIPLALLADAAGPGGRACAPTPPRPAPTWSARLGVVVTPIPAGGYGEVRVRIGGQPVKLNARAEQPVPLGARVFVVEAPSDTSVVVEESSPCRPHT